MKNVRGKPAAKKELLASDCEIAAMLEVIRAARAVVSNPAWAGVSDEDVVLERALNDLDKVLEKGDALRKAIDRQND